MASSTAFWNAWRCRRARQARPADRAFSHFNSLRLLPLIGLLLVGCANCDLVEAELRYQTNRIECLERELEFKEAEIQTLQVTVDDLLEKKGTAEPPEPAESIYQSNAISRVTLERTTGGRDLDGDGDHDAVQVLLSPRDYDDDPLKCPGEARVELHEFQESGVRKSLGAWNIPGDELRGTWQTSLFGSGYRLVLPWQQQPKRERLRVVVQFSTPDGRKFEAESDFTMRQRDSARTVSKRSPIGSGVKHETRHDHKPSEGILESVPTDAVPSLQSAGPNGAKEQAARRSGRSWDHSVKPAVNSQPPSMPVILPVEGQSATEPVLLPIPVR